MNGPAQLLPRPGRLAEPGNGGDFLPRGRPLGRAPKRGGSIGRPEDQTAQAHWPLRPGPAARSPRSARSPKDGSAAAHA
eukprot:14442423-Alexandrium_andersonii.AAC.1